MFTRFFIDRPIFASVLSIVITLAGAACFVRLPLAQFPSVAPPIVSVSCTYPGASAREVADAVAAPIEQMVNGVEGMMWMNSSSTNDGGYSLSVTFKPGVNLNMAQVLVQNRISLAIPNLPDVIKQSGVSVRKRAPDILMGFAIVSPDGRYDQLYLSNYVNTRIRDELSRIDGVADVFSLGQREYSMRIWLDPGKLSERGMTAMDVVTALRQDNAQCPLGQLGQPPSPSGQQLEVPLSITGRLHTVEQFEEVIVKSTADGRIVKLRDVARVELGARNQDIITRFNGQEAGFLAIFQQPDANALEVHDRVTAKMAELARDFPEGMAYEISFDTTPYTRESIKEVFKTLAEAILLVAFVVLLFLQNWRTAVIPLLAVPVAIIGTFAAMAAVGFSLNNLTMFGLVLAIGIVVDDAIVVVEAVEHNIELGLTPREATIRAMELVSGPVLTVGLVLAAVFIPCAFISGLTGAFFRQFALTIAVSTVISTINSLTLSPALCALLLKPRDKTVGEVLPAAFFAMLGGLAAWYFVAPLLHELLAGIDWLREPAAWLAPLAAATAGTLTGLVLMRPGNALLAFAFRLFNQGFLQATRGYTVVVGWMLRLAIIIFLLYGGLIWLTYQRFQDTPKGFIPAQDMGYLMVTVQLPDSASLERTEAVMKQVHAIARATPGVVRVTTIAGQSFALNASGSNFGSCFINLDDYPNRRSKDLYGEAIAANLRARFNQEIFDAQVNVLGPPPVRGVGRAGGFALMVQDRGDLGPNLLQEETDGLIAAGRQLKLPRKDTDGTVREVNALTGIFSVYRANVPQIRIQPIASAAMKKNVNLKDFADTLRICEGSLYVNDLNLFGRTFQLIVQADSRDRLEPADLDRLKVRNARGGMVPLGAVSRQQVVNGPLVITRYNLYPAALITGSTTPGVSSGEIMARLEQLADQNLAPSMGYEWTEMSYLEKASGATAMMLFGLAVVMVFLVLAAQYESWSLPLAVILVVPMCLLCSILGVRWAGLDINIFTQIGFVVLVGLACKNAILIVEYAREQRLEGVERHTATLEACKLRLRPIIMTSLAFILGVIPLMLSRGAGAEMRQTLGTAVFAGMVGVTLFGIFLTPVFFFVIDWLSQTRIFTSPLVLRMGATARDVVTLVALWKLGRLAWSRARKPRRPAATPAPLPRRDEETDRIKGT